MKMVNNGNKIVSGMFWRFGEKITAQLVSFVVSVVLARLLMPDDYGIVAIVNIFITIAEIFVTSGLGTSLIQKKEADEIDFSTVFWCNILLSFILYFVVFALAPHISRFYNIELLTPVLRVFSLRLPISAINSIQNAYISKRLEFKKFFFATLIGTIISAVVGITMAHKGYGVWALIAQYLTNSTIDTIVLFTIIDWKPHFVFSIKKAMPLFDYGWKILATDFVGTVFNQINSFVIGKTYSSSDLAYYSQGRKIPELINNNIVSTLSAVLFPAMSLCNNVEELKNIRRKSLMMLEYVIFPIMFGLIAIADNLIIVLLTDKWLFATSFLRISCLASVIAVLGTTLIQETKAIGRSDVTLKMELIKKPIYLIVLFVAIQFGVKAIAWTLVINEVIAFCFNVYPVKKYIGFDLKLYFSDAFSPLIMSLIMAVIVSGVGSIVNNNLMCLTLQIVIGGFIYIFMSIITKNKSFIYLLSIIKNKMNRG